MNREALVELVREGRTTREIAEVMGCSQTNVNYWVRKHGIELPRRRGRERRCGDCGTTDPGDFYGKQNGLCKACRAKYTLARFEENRRRAIDYLGGSCKDCGYNAHACALAIHHLDPSVKDATFASWRGWSWERLRAELDGCVLLCLNCHSVRHHEGDIAPELAILG